MTANDLGPTFGESPVWNQHSHPPDGFIDWLWLIVSLWFLLQWTSRAPKQELCLHEIEWQQKKGKWMMPIINMLFSQSEGVVTLTELAQMDWLVQLGKRELCVHSTHTAQPEVYVYFPENEHKYTLSSFSSRYFISNYDMLHNQLWTTNKNNKIN